MVGRHRGANENLIRAMRAHLYARNEVHFTQDSVRRVRIFVHLADVINETNAVCNSLIALVSCPSRRAKAKPTPLFSSDEGQLTFVISTRVQYIMHAITRFHLLHKYLKVLEYTIHPGIVSMIKYRYR